jgi:cation:H+ antiporter
MVFCPGIAKRSGYMLKAFLMLGACVTLAVFGLIGVLTWPAIVILLAVFVFFMFFNIKDAKKAILLGEGDGEEKPEKTKKLMIKNIILFIVGTLAVGGGALLLVEYGPKLAIMIGVPDAIVSAIFVAIGTSLPELVTAITAIAKKQGALSMGNIIGANIIDLAIILPVCALIGGGTLAFNLQNMYLDLPVCLLIGAIALAPSLITQKISRVQGISLLTVYTAYIILMCVYFI